MVQNRKKDNSELVGVLEEDIVGPKWKMGK